MARRARTYEAFISYSHAADERLAAQLQRTLNRIARPSYKWWQWWPPRVFRDQTNLPAGEDLTREIQRSLAASDGLVLLASPPAAASPWVDKEVAAWRSSKPPGRLFLALTEGTLVWDDARSCFDPSATTALPPSLFEAFDAEPLWVDFTAVREDRPFARDPIFLDGAATLAAAIRGVDKDALVGEDVRQRRRARQLAVGAITTVALLAIAATIAAIFAFIQRGRAIDREQLALSRQYAAQAIAELDLDPEHSVVLAARAASIAPTEEADSALRRALRTSRLRGVVEVGRSVNDVAVDADARVVAAAVDDGEVRIWDTARRRVLHTFRVDGGPARHVDLSTDGSRILGASQTEALVLAVTEDGVTPLATLPATDPILSTALSPDGRFAATGHRGGVVRLWRVDSGALERELRPRGSPEPITAAAFAPDGRSVAAAAGRRAVVWRIDGAPVRELEHESDVYAVTFSWDGRRLATGDDDGLVRLWNVAAPRPAVLVGHEGAVTSIAFSPDGQSLTSGGVDETARIWDVPRDGVLGTPQAELRGHTGLVQGVAFGPRGDSVLTGSSDGELRFWATAADPIRAELVPPSEATIKDVGFDPTARRLVTGGEDRTVRVWELRSGRVLREREHGTSRDWVEASRFDSSGRVVVSAATDGTVRIWEAADGKASETFGRPGGPALTDAALSPDGDLVLAGGADPAAWLWRRRDASLVARLRTPARTVNAVAYSPDGRYVALAAGRAVRVWRTGAFARPAAVFRDPGRLEQNEFWSVAFGPNGRVAAGDLSGWWFVWDVEERALVAAGKAAREAVGDVGFSADGTYLVTADWRGGARVWKLPGGSLVTATRTRSPRLEAAAFAPRGRLIVVGGEGGRVLVFECAECRPLRALVCLAEQRVTPSVRAQERDAFAACD